MILLKFKASYFTIYERAVRYGDFEGTDYNYLFFYFSSTFSYFSFLPFSSLPFRKIRGEEFYSHFFSFFKSVILKDRTNNTIVIPGNLKWQIDMALNNTEIHDETFSLFSILSFLFLCL